MKVKIGEKLSWTWSTLALAMSILLSLICENAEARVDYCKFSDNSTLLIVDRTTFYDDTDRRILADGLTSLYGDLGTGDRLVVHTITDDRAKSDKIFDNCYPGCPKEGLGSWLFSSCRGGLARSDRIDFRSNLAARLRIILLEHEKYPRSVIVETIVSLTKLNHSDKLTRLVVFSDLLENSLVFPWPMIVEARSGSMITAARKLNLLPRLTGVPVVVFGVGRQHDPKRSPLRPRQRQQLEGFWQELLLTGGAQSVVIGERYR